MHSLEPRRSLTVIWFGYVFFVVYGSLVPLDFKPLPIDQAWATFQHMQMYRLGVESRADWIANGVLYVLVGFLTTHLLVHKFSKALRIPLLFFAALLCVALALSVEFTQVFFPPRTISLNDLLAESIGSLIGLILAARYSERFARIVHAMYSNPRRLARHLLEAYLVGYLAFSLFPYDILLSAAEIEVKLAGDGWGWLLAGEGQVLLLVAVKSLAEIALTLPFGIFLGYRSARPPVTVARAIILGAVLGGAIEMAQFFTATGISQGLSVFTRAAGVGGGLILWNHRPACSADKLAVLARRYTAPLGVLYLVLLLYVNGWFSHSWNDTNFARAQLAELHLLPFYYHYFTTEAIALFSLASVCLMYLPIGLLTWSNRGSPARAFFYAAFVAGLVETSKLFLQGLHPDPTNIVLGAFASWGAVHLTRALAVCTLPTGTTEVATPLPRPSPPRQRVAPQTRNSIAYAVVVAALALVAYRAATFPTLPLVLCIALTIHAATLWRRPALLVAIIPAALPVLDLAPWSGRFFLDEFDLLVIISLAIGYARIPAATPQKQHGDALFALVSSLLAISFFIGALRGLTPWQTPDANSFTNYYSPFNALRIAKGALYAFLLYGLLRRLASARTDVERLLALGMTTGLAMTVAVILWERLTFVSLFDFASDYRVTGLFSSMHTGGAYIECYLATAAPFLVLLVLQARHWASRLLGIILLLATTYALMITFSRNGYSAFGVAMAIMLFFGAFRSGRLKKRGSLVAVLAGAMLTVALPVFTGSFAQDRILALSQDYEVRQDHWEDALNIRTPGLLAGLFGTGLGRYPETHYLLSREENHAGTYQLKKENDKTFIRLGSGTPIYLEQIVSIEPRQNYVLKLTVRSNKAAAQTAVSLCEKLMLTSFQCVVIPISADNETGAWDSVKVPFSSGALGDTPWYANKQVKLALLNSTDKWSIDIDNVRREAIHGENLLINGDFSNELDHWFFSEDVHQPWHTHSLSVAVLFDQGWFGLLAFSLFAILAIKRAAGRAWRGDLNAAAALASLSGFLVVGLFDTLIDAPRFLFLLLLLGWFGGFRSFTSTKGATTRSPEVA